MPDRTGKKRQSPISYRPPAALRQEFLRRAAASGLSLNAFITKAVLGVDPPRQSRRPSVNHELVARVLVELAALRDRLNALEGGGEAALLEQAVTQLNEIRAACFQALERKP